MNIKRNLRTIARKATDEQVAQGLVWYARANGIAAELGNRYGVSADDAAAVIAILSPTNKWARNVQDAASVLRHVRHGGPVPTVCTYGNNLTKALAYARGDRSQLRGPKVTAFAANIRGDHDFVTLDIWACRAAVRRDEPGADRSAIELAYRTVAAEFGYSPAAFQAIIWTAIRGSAV